MNLSWRILYNYEIDQVFNEPDVVTFLKRQRLRWAGHIVRTEEDNPVKKLTFQKHFGSRRKGRPKLRWIDVVEASGRERMEKKDVGEGRIEECAGGSQGSKRTVAPPMTMTMVVAFRTVTACSLVGITTVSPKCWQQP
jgi:hypothetical protein